MPPLYKRRKSSRDALSGVNGQVHPVSPDVQTAEEPAFQSWSNLLASIPAEERRTSQIRRHHLIISIPVCVIGKENPVTFTSMDAIEQTLRRLYPEILVKKKGGGKDGDGLLEMLDTSDDLSINVKESKQKIATEPKKDRRVSVASLSEKRRMSINTCITTMRKDIADYDKQLNGVKSVGAFAEEETLKVLFAKPEAIKCIIEAMQSFPEKEELQLNACKSLHKMASASETNCVHILDNNGIAAISGTLRRHHDSAVIVRVLLSTVAFISTAVDLAIQLVEGGLHSEILSVMSRHASDREIVRESCFIIGNLLVTVEAVHQLMLVGGVHTIISMVEQFPDDERILENACRTLGSFAIYDETCLDVASAGATRTVFQSMTAPSANVTVLECGCWALASLTASDSTCEEVVRLDGVDIILSVLEDYPLEENLQEYGIRVLCNLSSVETTVHFVCKKEVVELIQKVMNNFPESVELLEITVVTLSQVAAGESGMYHRLAETHCIIDLVRVMMSLPDNRMIQEHGCKIIGNMAVHDDLRKQAEGEGASKAVISAMLTLDNVPDIQEVCCLALMNLTADNKDNKVRIKNAGAVPSLLNTLREFDSDPGIVLCALKALGNLVSLEEVCHLLLDESGLDTVINLVETHEGNSDILVFIALVLCGITELPDLKEEEAALIDKTLMGILSSIQNNPDVTLYVCQAIENLVRTDIGRGTFMRENRMGVILSAMNSFTDNSHIHRCCCKVIAVVALYLDTKRRLITETTLKCVLRSMELFPNDVELQIIGCGTLSCIVEKIAILKHELIGHGGISLMDKGVHTHTTESRLAVVALMVLGHIVPIDSSTYQKEAKLAFDTILFCMASFPENKELQISACKALKACEIKDNEDVHQLIRHVTFAIKRHALEPEVKKAAEAVLRPYQKIEQYQLLIDGSLNSPTAKAKKFHLDEVLEKKEQLPS